MIQLRSAILLTAFLQNCARECQGQLYVTNPSPSVMEGILTSRSVTPSSDENPEFRVDDFVTMIVEAASGSDDVTTSGQLDSVVTVQDQDVKIIQQQQHQHQQQTQHQKHQQHQQQQSEKVVGSCEPKKSSSECCETSNKCNSGCCSPQTGSGSTGGNQQNMKLALDPVQSDFLAMNIKTSDEKPYNIHELPSIDGQPVLVEISVSLRNILEIDEHKQLVTLETTLRLYWRDPRLKVEHILGNKSNDNSYVLLHPEAGKYIWFPDIYIDFAKALRLPTVVIRPASLRIYRNSTARYATQINYDVACPMKFHKYPYDTQTCKVKYESYGHTVERMRVVWKKGFDQSKVTENNYISLAQFEYAVFFEENYEEEIASGVYPGVIMTILLRRKISYHLLQTYLPSGLFVIVAWLSLFLPPESIPGRVTMAMTTLLTLAAMFGAVRQSTPKVSYVSALDIWMCTCIIFVFFALLEYVVVLCLINHCQVGGGPSTTNAKTTTAPSSSTTPRKSHTKKSTQMTQQLCRRHSYLAGVASTNEAATSDVTTMTEVTTLSASRAAMGGNNGLKVMNCGCDSGSTADVCCGGNEALIGSGGRSRSQSGKIEIQEFSSETRLKKRVGLFFCCPTRSVRKSRGGKTEFEHIRLSNKRRAAGCNGHQPGSAEKSKRPFQNVEKTCSITMAILFIIFNMLYWPWLLSDDDFDYAKFELLKT